MGQQQLLLIVLGVIIVGIAIVVGINLFNANAESSTKDSLVNQGTNIGALAQQYFKKPTAMGGGGNSFVNFDTTYIGSSLLHSSDANWVISTAGTADTIVFKGTPRDYTSWHVYTYVGKTSGISSKVTTP